MTTTVFERTFRVQRAEGESGRWELITTLAPPHLRPYVAEYQGYLETWSRPLMRRELPHGLIVFVLNLGAPFRIGPSREERDTRTVGSFVAGLYTGHTFAASTGPTECLQLNLTPLGARLIFGVPMCELADRTVSFNDLTGPIAAELEERLASTADWPERFAIVDRFLSARLPLHGPTDPAVAWAWSQLARSRGTAKIGMLTDELGWSPRRLIAAFEDQIGLSPKQTARILRFHHVTDLIDDERQRSWAEIAAVCGYSDQAHLVREFTALAGLPPATYLRTHSLDGEPLKQE